MVLAKYDKTARAFYLKFPTQSKRAAKTIPLGDDKFLDVDEAGNVMGFEILITTKQIPPDFEEIINRTPEIETT